MIVIYIVDGPLFCFFHIYFSLPVIVVGKYYIYCVHTESALHASVSRKANAREEINFCVADGAIVARPTVTFVDIYKQLPHKSRLLQSVNVSMQIIFAVKGGNLYGTRMLQNIPCVSLLHNNTRAQQ